MAVPEKMAAVRRQYEELCTAADLRRRALEETVTYHVLMGEVGEVEGWVTEQERMVTKTELAEELPFLVHQLSKFGEFVRVLAGTEPQLAAVNERAGNVIDQGHSKEVSYRPGP